MWANCEPVIIKLDSDYCHYHLNVYVPSYSILLAGWVGFIQGLELCARLYNINDSMAT